jgi:hypothetical protein
VPGRKIVPRSRPERPEDPRGPFSGMFASPRRYPRKNRGECCPDRFQAQAATPIEPRILMTRISEVKLWELQ